MTTMHTNSNDIQVSSTGLGAPTKAYRYAAVAALLIGSVSYMIGLVNAEMALNEKGYYFAVLLYGLFSVVSLQKTVRDKAENIPTSKIYYMLAWASTGLAIALLCVGLYNAELFLSEKGFFGMAYTLSLFASITVQKNVRDMQRTKSSVKLAKVEENSDTLEQSKKALESKANQRDDINTEVTSN